jgi:hypothetical protein
MVCHKTHSRLLYNLYEVFDAEELLEGSINSIKSNVDYVCVVYQTTSNFGHKCNPYLEELLEDLVKRGLVNDLVYYEPRQFSAEEKESLVSSKVGIEELGGLPTSVGEQVKVYAAYNTLITLPVFQRNDKARDRSPEM